jgi:hypothetical protein
MRGASVAAKRIGDRYAGLMVFDASSQVTAVFLKYASFAM